MSQQKNEEFFGSLPALKASALLMPSKSKVITISRIVNECYATIKEYNLDALVKKAKFPDGFINLEDRERELLCAGLIKLGEALTFCRDNRVLTSTGIVPHANVFSAARNHFVHHYMYHDSLNWHSKTQECIDKLFLINVLAEKLEALQGCSIKTLTKPVRKGENDFPFKYSIFVDCLKTEFFKLNSLLMMDNILEKIISNMALRASLENRIRNILSIMADLIDTELLNKNEGAQCGEQKRATQKINQLFVETFKEHAGLFRDFKEFRNSLCHLDNTLKKPYRNIEEMLTFAMKLQKMQHQGYVEQLEKPFLQENEGEVSAQSALSVESRDSAASSSSSSIAQESSSQSDEIRRQNKVVATPSTKTAKAVAAAATAASVFDSLSVYNSDSDEDSKNDSKDQTQTNRPKMGGR